jgi:N-acetylmuramoyl-L-alanine amidase
VAAACAAALAAGLAVVAVGHAATESVGLIKVRMGGDSAETRTVLDLDGAVSAKLVSDGAADGRVVILLPNAAVEGARQGAGRGLVKAWLVDQAKGGARLQLDLAGPARVKRRFLLPPADGVANYRYVVDLAAAPKAAGAGIKGPLRAEEPPPLPLKKVVVIDAGHGGKDVGAQGAEGFEKDVNLAAAVELARQLRATGRYKVVLTRSTDVYIPLEDRVRIAQRADADLFISLHSDSAPEAELKGASVYTLSDQASARAAQFVGRDDWFMKASLTGDQGVRDILFDLTQRATRNRSAIFAQTLVSDIEPVAPLLRRSHRDAGFMVLLAPEVPAVLLEMGFVSNPEDEARLRDPAARAKLMGAVAKAIEAHFDDQVRVAAR